MCQLAICFIPTTVQSFSSEMLKMHRAALEASSQRTFKHALPHADGHEKGGVTVLDLKDMQHGHRQLLVDRGEGFIFRNLSTSWYTIIVPELDELAALVWLEPSALLLFDDLKCT